MKLHCVAVTALIAACGLYSVPIGAQELEPRAYAPAPKDINFVGVAYARSEGELLFDPSIPVKNVHAAIESLALAYGQTFELWKHSASATLIVPYVSGDLSGEVIATGQQEIHRAGIGDAHLRLSYNFLGEASFLPGIVSKRDAKAAVGAGLHVVAPTGKYNPDYAVNIGTNRWALKTEVGVSKPISRWLFEATAGVWFFTANDDAYGGSRREQEPMATLQGHVSYTFKPGLWLSTGLTYYRGGQTQVDGNDLDDRQNNARVGATLALPAGKGHSVKIAWTQGARVRFGGDFDTYGVSWQYAWKD